MNSQRDSVPVAFSLAQALVALGWALAAACNLAVLYGLVHYGAGVLNPPPKDINAAYAALNRTAWGLGLAWVVFACARGYGGEYSRTRMRMARGECSRTRVCDFGGECTGRVSALGMSGSACDWLYASWCVCVCVCVCVCGWEWHYCCAKPTKEVSFTHLIVSLSSVAFPRCSSSFVARGISTPISFRCSSSGFVNTLMSWPAIIPLSRLTYAAYLVHPIVLYYYNLVLESTIFFNEVVYVSTGSSSVLSLKVTRLWKGSPVSCGSAHGGPR